MSKIFDVAGTFVIINGWVLNDIMEKVELNEP